MYLIVEAYVETIKKQKMPGFAPRIFWFVLGRRFQIGPNGQRLN